MLKRKKRYDRIKDHSSWADQNNVNTVKFILRFEYMRLTGMIQVHHYENVLLVLKCIDNKCMYV